MAVMVVGSLDALFAALVSPPPFTVAVLVTLAGALAATLAVSVMAGKADPMARTSLRVQVSVASVHVQPVPLTAVGVSPGGSVSTTVTTPELGPVPTLATVIEYVAPTCPCEKFPTWVLAIDRSGGNAVTVVGSVAVLFPTLVSPPPLTVALLVMLAAALVATLTVTVIDG